MPTHTHTSAVKKKKRKEPIEALDRLVAMGETDFSPHTHILPQPSADIG